MKHRLIVTRWNNDVIAGYHLRNYNIEEDAAREALRLLQSREEPKRAPWCVFPVAEGKSRGAFPWEAEKHYRWRVWEYWRVLGEVYAPGKAKRPSAKRKAVRS